MYEPYPHPPVGVTVFHKGRDEFGKVVRDAADPDSIILQIDGEELEVSRHFLERSIFAEDNRVH